ncbi:conjugal transfer protein TraO [Zooshikella marina]|uniref:conjugal transfer protein TraO n=1 Tax=Zooshikella ganghwensis TaxID=202772 RepID=UPI001BAF6562|nr:conjugal transfer protein TraO [Zooshikella ganghwensis]MBU2708739.1 conjugal transfer protein TraO [Zooshikella ganghwensis]
MSEIQNDTTQNDASRHSKAVLVAAMGLVFAVAYLGISYLTDKPETPSHISGLGNTSSSNSQESEHYKKTLNEYNKNKADIAENSGDSYLSVLSARTKDKPLAEDENVQNNQPQVVYRYIEVPQQQQQQPVNYEADVAQLDSIITQTVMNNWQATSHSAATVTEEKGYASSLMPVNFAGGNNAGPGQQGIPAEKIVEDFALIPGTLETDIDTDENSGVSVVVTSGKYAGMRVYSEGYKLLTKTVDVNLLWMQWKGKSYKIKAKLVDQHSGRTSLSGEVNNRYFSRIILPAIAQGISKAGQIYEESGTTTSVSDGVIVQSRDGNPSGKQITGAFVGGLGSQTASVMRQDAARMPIRQVLVPKNETVGIQFYGPVLSTDEVRANDQQNHSLPSVQYQPNSNGYNLAAPPQQQPYYQPQYQQIQGQPVQNIQPQYINQGQLPSGVYPIQPQPNSQHYYQQQPALR